MFLQVSFGEVTSSCPGKECTEDINESNHYLYITKHTICIGEPRLLAAVALPSMTTSGGTILRGPIVLLMVSMKDATESGKEIVL